MSKSQGAGGAASPAPLPKLSRSPHFLLLLAFSVFALAPLTAPGYFVFAHDARHSVYFLQMFDQSMRDGAWFPRWAPDMVFGYGYPLWIILAPLPFFIGEAFHLVGFDFVAAVKIVAGLNTKDNAEATAAMQQVLKSAKAQTVLDDARKQMGRLGGSKTK